MGEHPRGEATGSRARRALLEKELKRYPVLLRRHYDRHTADLLSLLETDPFGEFGLEIQLLDRFYIPQS
jgi:hypothetical protein